MEAVEIEVFVDQVAADAERTFGADIEPELLEHCAREAVHDLWLTRARVTVDIADRAARGARGDRAAERRADGAAARGPIGPTAVVSTIANADP